MLTADEIDARRHEARKRELVERILPLVEELLEAAGGYVHLKVEDILQNAGLSRSTFYRYFKDKNDLLLALSEPALREIRTAALRTWELGPDVTFGQFEAELYKTMEAYRPHVALMSALVEVSTYDARVKQLFFFGYCNGYHQYFPTIEAVAEGGYGADNKVSPVAVGAGEQMMNTALIWIYQMLGRIP